MANAQNLQRSLSSINSYENALRKCNTFKDELNMFANTGHIMVNIQRLSVALNSVKPTSTESQRNFSTYGDLVSRKRTRLSDETVFHCLTLSRTKKNLLKSKKSKRKLSMLSREYYNFYFYNMIRSLKSISIIFFLFLCFRWRQ